jgi:hypothetical protein
MLTFIKFKILVSLESILEGNPNNKILKKIIKELPK